MRFRVIPHFLKDVFSVLLENNTIVGIKSRPVFRLGRSKMNFIGHEKAFIPCFVNLFYQSLRIRSSLKLKKKFEKDNSGFCTYYLTFDFLPCWGICLMSAEIDEVSKLTVVLMFLVSETTTFYIKLKVKYIRHANFLHFCRFPDWYHFTCWIPDCSKEKWFLFTNQNSYFCSVWRYFSRFKLEIQQPLPNIFRANVGHHCWPMKKIFTFFCLEMTLINCFISVGIKTVVFLPRAICDIFRILNL